MDFLINKINDHLDEQLLFQSAAYTKTQVFHENLNRTQLADKLKVILPLYKQVQMQTTDGELTALINKKGKAAIKVKGRQADRPAKADWFRLQHNRTKNYILQEGAVVPFLQDLGVMTAEGKIVRTKYDKFRQSILKMCCHFCQRTERLRFWILGAVNPTLLLLFIII